MLFNGRMYCELIFKPEGKSFSQNLITRQVKFYLMSVVTKVNISYEWLLTDYIQFCFTATRQNVISDHKADDIPPQMNILNMVIPIRMHFLTFIRQTHSNVHHT